MPEPMSSPSTVNAPGKKPAPRRSGASALLNLLLLIGIIIVIGLFVRAEMQRRDTAKNLEATKTELAEVRKSTQQGGEELAKQVLEKVRTHMDVPTDPAPTVATIVDVESLKKSNEFYNVAKNGDHLIITQKRAILYAPDRNLILDVVPVVIDPNASPAPSTPPGAPAATPVPSVSPVAPR